MMKVARIIAMVAIVVGLMSTSGFALNTMDVNAGAALEGGFGLEINHDGSANKVYVQDNTPSDETTYRARFLLHLDPAYTMTGPDNHPILRVWEDSGPSPFRLVLGQFRDGRWFIRAFYLQNNGNFRFLGGTIISLDTTTAIGVEWQAGTGNGIFRLYKEDNLKKEKLNCDNDYEVDFVRLGALAWIDAATDGSYYLDSFESYRTLAP